MPFKSEAQRKKFQQLEAEGKLPEGTSAKWEKETKKQGVKILPQYARSKKFKIKEI